jgi:probable addiction module antidote protein
MAIKTKVWDAAEHLTSREAMVSYLGAALEDGDPSVIAAALGDIAKAKGMADVARKAGVSRESLYRSLSANGNPELGTFVKIVNSFGLQLSIKAQPKRRKLAAHA